MFTGVYKDYLSLRYSLEYDLKKLQKIRKPSNQQNKINKNKNNK